MFYKLDSKTVVVTTSTVLSNEPILVKGYIKDIMSGQAYLDYAFSFGKHNIKLDNYAHIVRSFSLWIRALSSNTLDIYINKRPRAIIK